MDYVASLATFIGEAPKGNGLRELGLHKQERTIDTGTCVCVTRYTFLASEHAVSFTLDELEEIGQRILTLVRAERGD